MDPPRTREQRRADARAKAKELMPREGAGVRLALRAGIVVRAVSCTPRIGWTRSSITTRTPAAGSVSSSSSRRASPRRRFGRHQGRRQALRSLAARSDAGRSTSRPPLQPWPERGGTDPVRQPEARSPGPVGLVIITNPNRPAGELTWRPEPRSRRPARAPRSAVIASSIFSAGASQSSVLRVAVQAIGDSSRSA